MDFRERYARFPLEFVSRKSRISLERLSAIEAGAAASVFELDRLASIYGVDDADVLAEEPIRLKQGDSLTVLALHQEFQDTSHEARAAILRAAQAARDVVVLQALTDSPRPTRAAFRLPAARKDATGFEVGKERAQAVRNECGLGSSPIVSMRDFVRDHFPAFVVLHAHLGDDISGLAFGDKTRGPTIVLNLGGKNANPLVRRFSLAHELAHLLFDWNRQAPFAQLSGFKEPRALEVEQRANAFAMRLLCPESELKRLVEESDDPALLLATTWGVHFEAARLYLSKVAQVEVPRVPSAAILSVQARSIWVDAEDQELSGFPLAGTPPERRTVIAQLAAKAYSTEAISRDRFARFLGLTPDAEVERVMDFYALDSPS